LSVHSKIRDLTGDFISNVKAVLRPSKPATSSSYSLPKTSYSIPKSVEPRRTKPLLEVAGAEAKVESISPRTARRVLPNTRPKKHNAVSPKSQSPESDDPAEEAYFKGINLEEYKKRGTGDHYCPMQFKCSRGGVHAEGQLFNFKRNSLFLYVLVGTSNWAPWAMIIFAG
jgi:hypothetical protein